MELEVEVGRRRSKALPPRLFKLWPAIPAQALKRNHLADKENSLVSLIKEFTVLTLAPSLTMGQKANLKRTKVTVDRFGKAARELMISAVGP